MPLGVGINLQGAHQGKGECYLGLESGPRLIGNRNGVESSARRHLARQSF